MSDPSVFFVLMCPQLLMMNHSEMMKRRRHKSLVRYFLRLLQSSYSEYLTSSVFINQPLPTEDQYYTVKNQLGHMLLNHLEEQFDASVEAVAEVIGQDTVQRIINNWSSFSTSESGEDVVNVLETKMREQRETL